MIESEKKNEFERCGREDYESFGWRKNKTPLEIHSR
jgi:hypothetical protein